MKTILLIIALTCTLLWFSASPANDMTPRYIGAQMALSGISPYSDTATQKIQIGYYGRAVDAHEDQQRFAYPGYSLFVFAPLSFFPLRFALVVWEGVQLVLVLFALRRLGIKPLHAALILVALKEPVVNLLVGNVALWVTAWVGFGMAALNHQQSKLAGLYFTFAALQPVVAVPLALLILATHRRALLSYVVAMAGVGGASLLLWGFWIPDWLDQIRAYTGYVNYLVWLPALFPPVVLVSLAALWNGVRNGNGERYGYIMSGLVTALPLTGLYHLSLFALVKLPARWWLLVGVLMWGMSALPFAVRQFEPLALVGVVIAFTLSRNRVRALQTQTA